MTETDALLGVVGFPVEPPDGAPDALAAQVSYDNVAVPTNARIVTEVRDFDQASAAVTAARDAVARRLIELRNQRAEINEEIRRLVAEDAVLQRMARLATATITEES